MNNDPPKGCEIKLPNESDINNWEVTMEGPPDSPYAVSNHTNSTHPELAANTSQGGRFIVSVSLPKDYPFKPPVISFKTKVYHPNVSNDERGAMCLGMLRADAWKPPNKIKEVLTLVRTVLAAPQPDDAVETGIAEQYKNDRAAFDKAAKDWVERYAK